MMDDTNPFTPPLPVTEPAQTGDGAPAAAAEPSAASQAVMKFQSCRWRCDPDSGEFCTHRDVLPFAGKEGFVAESWCPDCGFYKLRRTPKKRDYNSY